MQLWLRPYREPESNQLKVLVETQIFLTFLLSFILRVLPSDGRSSLEPLGATFYGWVLVASLLALCTAALLLTAAQVSHVLHCPRLACAPNESMDAERVACEQSLLARTDTCHVHRSRCVVLCASDSAALSPKARVTYGGEAAKPT